MNKRLIIIFVCMVIFVLTLVVGAVVFSVSDVNILFLKDENTEQFDKAKIFEVSGIKKGQSVFTIDAEKTSEKIEKQFPELKVVGVTRDFPNKIRIQLDVRTPIFILNLNSTDDKYAILDNELKIVKIVNSGEANAYQSLLPIEDLNFKGNEDMLGDKLTGDSIDLNALTEVVKALESLGVVTERIPATFARFSFVENEKISLQTTLGLTLVIKTNASISTYTQCRELYVEFYNMSNEIRESSKYLSYNEYTGKPEISDKGW